MTRPMRIMGIRLETMIRDVTRMIDEDLPDWNLPGLEELLDDIYGLPDIHIDELAALLELPDRIAGIATAWPW